MQAGPLWLFLDFDGTLAPIVKHPNAARLSADVRAALVALARDPACQVTIVTGRALADIRRRVGLRGIIYVADHGFEICGPGLRRKNVLPARCRKVYAQIIRDLRRHLKCIPGVILECKGATLSVHYRLVPPASLRLFNQTFIKITQPYLAPGEVRLRKGKKVYEPRPPVPWDKGKAVAWLLHTAPKALGGRNGVIMYIGDDDTDEDAFIVLKREAFAIRVGRARCSAAQYYLSNTTQVAALLAHIVQIRKGKFP